LTAKHAQQQLNRVRELYGINHYLHFYGITKKKTLNEYQKLKDMYNDMMKSREKILGLTFKFEQYQKGDIIDYEPDDYMTKLYIKSILRQNISDADFKNNFIKEVLRRGASFSIITDLDKEIHDTDNHSKKYLNELIDEIKMDKINTILSSELITTDQAEILKSKSIVGRISKNEELQLSKYHLYNIYQIKSDANIIDVKNFILDYADGLKLNKKLNNWYNYIISPDKGIDHTEFELKNSSDMKKPEMINLLLKKIGFENGILSTNIINKLYDFNITQNEFIQLRQIFREDGDKGQYRGESKNVHMYVKYISRICEEFYGVQILFDSIKINRVMTYFDYQIKVKNVIEEYLILKNEEFVNVFNTFNQFNYSHIHGNNYKIIKEDITYNDDYTFRDNRL